MLLTASIANGESWENRYAHDKQSENADQAEWDAVLNGVAHFSVGTGDEAMAEAGDEFAASGAEDLIDGDRLQGQEILQEARQGAVYEQVLERKNLLGDDYPFDIAGNSLLYKPSHVHLYELLLGICQAPSLTKNPYTILPRLFEELSLLAGCGYLGPRADGYRAGWPRPKDVTSFKNAINQLAQQSGGFLSEWQWQPAEHLPQNPSPRYVKDGGLDIVIWAKWRDGRVGQLYLLGQCACGSDWLDKNKDLDLADLKEWFRLPRVKPVRSFFTPRYAVGEILHEMSKTAGLTFDRVRIVQALGETHIRDRVNALHEKIKEALEIAKNR